MKIWIFHWSSEANDIFSGDYHSGHRHMCFIYSSSFIAVTQSSMARTVYRQMQFTSPLLNFKGQLTACPECLLWILWAQLNHRDRKLLLEKHSSKRGRQFPPSLPSWLMDYDIEMLQEGDRLPIPFRAMSQISPTCITFSIHHHLEGSKSRHVISLPGSFDSYHKSQHLCNHPGMNLPFLSTGAQTEHYNDSFWPCKYWLFLHPPLWCSLLSKETT